MLSGLERLLSRPEVAAVQLDHPGRPMTSESAVAMRADSARAAFGVSGRGTVVAVLDTGVDLAHPDIAGSVVAQKCFALGACPPAGADTGELATDEDSHGTHVAGTITGSGKAAPRGIAPDARIAAVRVFDSNSVGRVSDWVAALDWVLAQRAALGIRVVNMSLGTDSTFPGNCDEVQPALAAAARKLRAEGVLIFAASGNDGSTSELSAPACNSEVVAVGATYDSSLGREPDTGTYQAGCFDAAADAGTLACLTNRGPMLDLLAPGSRIRAAVPGGGVAEKRGTSQAAPHASAASALLLEADPRLSADELESTLKATGVPVADPAGGRSYPSIDAYVALASVREGYCGRREDGAQCLLSSGCVADGGCAMGQCAGGVCATLVPAATGAYPRASGCSSSSSAAPLLLVLALFLLRRRRVFGSPSST